MFHIEINNCFLFVVSEEDEKLKASRTLANEAMEIVKNAVGSDGFIVAYSSIKKRLTLKRSERKKRKLLGAVANPQKAAIKKTKMNLQKREAKKRKNNRLHPSHKSVMKKKREML